MQNQQQQPDVPQGDQQPKVGAMKKTGEQAKKVANLVKEKCTDKVLRVSNIVAILLFLLGSIFRILFCFSGRGEEGFNFFFMLTTFYFVVFTILLGLSEAPETIKAGIIVNTYFNFLDKQFGKGLFMLFMCLMLCEVTDNAEPVLAVVIVIIAICNLIIGWNQAKRELPSLPWESGSAAAQAIANKAAGSVPAAAGGDNRAEQYKMAKDAISSMPPSMQGAAAGFVAGQVVAQAQQQFGNGGAQMNTQDRIEQQEQEMGDIDAQHDQLKNKNQQPQDPARQQKPADKAADVKQPSMQSVDLPDPYENA